MPKFQFSVRDLVLWTTAVCVVLSLTISMGDLEGSLFLFFLGTFLVSSLLPNRALTILTLVALFLSTLPWLGASGFVFIYPGSETPLPTLRSPETLGTLPLVDDTLTLAYRIAELPLHVAADGAYHQYICFPGTWWVRPFAFFVFWLGLTIVLGAARWSGHRRERKARGQPRPL